MSRSNHNGRLMFAPLLFIIFAIICFSCPVGAQNKVAQTPSETVSIPLLVALGRNQCTPCKMMAPALDQLRRDYKGRLNIEFIDIREHPEAVKKYAIHGIPFQILYDASGKELKRHYGYMSRDEILNMLRELGVELNKTPIEKTNK